MNVKFSLKKYALVALPGFLIFGIAIFMSFREMPDWEEVLPTYTAILIAIIALNLFIFLVSTRRSRAVITEERIEIRSFGRRFEYHLSEWTNFEKKRGFYPVGMGNYSYGWYFSSEIEGKSQKMGMGLLFFDQNTKLKIDALEIFLKKQISLDELGRRLKRIDEGMMT